MDGELRIGVGEFGRMNILRFVVCRCIFKDMCVCFMYVYIMCRQQAWLEGSLVVDG